MSNNISVSMHLGSGKNAINNMDKIKRADLHNNRKYKNNKNEEIDLSLSQYNITLVGTKNIVKDIKDFYKTEFGEALYNYNKKQNREDRKIVDYLEKMNSDTKSNIAVEMIFQIGDKKDWQNATMEDKQKTIEIFKKAIPILQEKNIKCFNASLHLDETSPHLHLLAVPVVENQTRGLEKQVSQNKVITKAVLNDIRKEIEKEFLTEYNRIFNTNKELKKGCEIEEHLSVEDYKNTKKILEVTKKVTDKQILKEKIEKDLKSVTAETIEKEKQLKNVNKQLNEVKNDIDYYTNYKEKLENNKKNLQEEIENLEKIGKENLESQLSEEAKELYKIKKEIEENKKDLEKRKDDFELIKLEITNIELKEEFINEKKKKLEELKVEEKELDKETEEVREKIELLTMYKNNIIETNEKIDSLKKEFNKLEDERLEKERENQEQKERIKEQNRIRSTQETILKDLENAEKINEERKKRLKKLEEENTALQEKIKIVESNIKVYSNQLTKLETEEKELVSTVEIKQEQKDNKDKKKQLNKLLRILKNDDNITEETIYKTFKNLEIYNKETAINFIEDIKRDNYITINNIDDETFKKIKNINDYYDDDFGFNKEEDDFEIGFKF